MVSKGILVAALVAAAPVAALAGPNGNVLSNNLRDADGTTGQDSTRGSGVKTPHLQDGAVTAPKLAPGAVSASALAAGAVGAAALQDGAVTDAKIAGPISRAKIQKYAGVAIVAKSGGDYADPVAAMNDLATWCSAPPCLVQIMPGTYDVGQGLAIRNGVDIAGSGRGVTSLVGGPDGTYESNAVVEGWSYAALTSEVRDLTIQHTNPGYEGVGVINVPFLRRVSVIVASGTFASVGVVARNGGAVTLEDVSVEVGGASYNIGVTNLWESPLTLRNSAVTATGGANAAQTLAFGVGNGPLHELTSVRLRASAAAGTVRALQVLNPNTRVALRDAIVTAEGPGGRGIYASQAAVTVEGSAVAAEAPVEAAYEGTSIRVGLSRLDGGPVIAAPGANVVCAGVTDESFAFYPNTCP